MKRTVFLLTLALCVSAACARAETVYDRGELYDVMNVYAKPDLLSEHLMTYFSGTPVDVMENVAGQEDEIYAHMRRFGTATDTRRFFFRKRRPMCPAAFCRCLWRTLADGESSICGIGRAEAGGFLRKFRTARRSR